jgi:hypothetical protein
MIHDEALGDECVLAHRFCGNREHCIRATRHDASLQRSIGLLTL